MSSFSIEAAHYDINVSGDLVEDAEVSIVINDSEYNFTTSDGRLSVDDEEARLYIDDGYIYQSDDVTRISLPEGYYIEKNPISKEFRYKDVSIKRRNKDEDIKFSHLIRYMDVPQEALWIFIVGLLFYNPIIMSISIYMALEGNMWAVNQYLDNLKQRSNDNTTGDIKDSFVSGDITIDELENKIDERISNEKEDDKIIQQELEKSKNH